MMMAPTAARAIDPRTTAADARPQYSVVVPFFNESASAVALLTEITEVMERLPAAYEMILVNDGSTDTTRAILSSYVDQHHQCRLLDLVKNRGQGAALYAGLAVARGSVVITMDGD